MFQKIVVGYDLVILQRVDHRLGAVVEILAFVCTLDFDDAFKRCADLVLALDASRHDVSAAGLPPFQVSR